MKCDACGTTAQPPSTNRAFRCLNCGTLLNVTAATAPPPVGRVGLEALLLDPPRQTQRTGPEKRDVGGRRISHAGSRQVRRNGDPGKESAVVMGDAERRGIAQAAFVRGERAALHLGPARFRRFRAPGGTSPATGVRRSQKPRYCAGRAAGSASSAGPGRLRPISLPYLRAKRYRAGGSDTNPLARLAWRSGAGEGGRVAVRRPGAKQ